MLTTLDVVNAQLATMGEAPLTSLSIPHPYVAAGLNYLRRHSRQFQTLGWWFNTATVDVTPDAENDYSVEGQLPCGILSIRGPRGRVLSLRGTGMYDHQENAQLQEPVEGVTVVYELPFSDLPPTAQQYAMDRAVLAFQKDYDGSDSKSAACARDVQSSYVLMNTEHIRTIKMNKIRNPGTLEKILAAGGFGGRSWGLRTR